VLDATAAAAIADAFAVEHETAGRCVASVDGREMVTAFSEKRPADLVE
jgi:hypothetical protein